MKLFVYGTLKYKETLSLVLGRKDNLPKYVPAVLKDFVKYNLNILPYKGKEVDGFVIDVTESDLKKLDYYECVQDELYKRIEVEPIVNNEKIKAIAYQMVGTE